MQFTVTLYKSYKLIFLKHRGCRHQGVWQYGACASFYSLIIAMCMLAIGLCVLPVHRVYGGFPHTIHLYHFGFDYLFKHFGLVVILCKYVSSDCVSQRSAETHGVTSTAPLPLHICDAARVTVQFQFKAEVTGIFSTDGGGLYTTLVEGRIQVSQSSWVLQGVLPAPQLLFHQHSVVLRDTSHIWCPMQIFWFSSGVLNSAWHPCLGN